MMRASPNPLSEGSKPIVPLIATPFAHVGEGVYRHCRRHFKCGLAARVEYE
jgi:hypothetical protein